MSSVIKLIYRFCNITPVPTKATGSHPVSALIALIAASMLEKYVWELLPPIGAASQAALYVINSNIIPVPTGSEAAGAVVVFLFVTVLWEVSHYIRQK
jgi:hypothetical protein